MASNSSQTYQFDLNLPDVLRSLSFYCTDENGEKQLRFDPPVYQARYSAVLSVLSKTDWAPHFKKVKFEIDLKTTMKWPEFMMFIGNRIRMCRHELGNAITPN